jgi:hypothetical protein
MDVQTIALVIAGGAALGVVVWLLLAKLGRALVKIAEALAAAAVVFFTMWLMVWLHACGLTNHTRRASGSGALNPLGRSAFRTDNR